MSRFRLSIVIIARNEEQTITNAIGSAMMAASQVENIKSYEIIFVDDSSTDKTVEKIIGFPITVLQHEQQAGPSAARFSGYKYMSPDTDFVLFVDGDTTVCKNWLSAAIRYMLMKPKVAGVSGRFIRSYSEETNSTNDMESCNNAILPEILHGTPQLHLPGSASMYLKKVIDEVGPFCPWLRGGEEQELGFRIRQRDFELHRLNLFIALSHIKKSKESVFHRMQFSRGLGQLFSAYRGTPLFRELIITYYGHFLVFGWVVFSTPIAALSLVGLVQPILWKFIGIFSILGYLAAIKKKGGILKATRTLIALFFESLGILSGLREHTDTTLPKVHLLKKSNQIQNK